MKYTKAEATILLAGVVKSIEKKWEPLASGEFKERVEPACALCSAYVKVENIRDDRNPNGCDACPLRDNRGRVCWEDGHVFSRWCNEYRVIDGSFRKAVNSPRAVKAAGRVLASLRRAEKRLRKVVSK